MKNHIIAILHRIRKLLDCIAFGCSMNYRFDDNTSEVEKREIYNLIRESVTTSVARRKDPIPGSSLVFDMGSKDDVDEYHRVAKLLEVE